jgi:predicted SAM-dependent methyltransferase
MIKKIVKKLLPAHVLEGLEIAKQNIEQQRELQAGAEIASKIIQQNQEVLLEIGSGAKMGANGWTTLDMSDGCDIKYDLLLPLPFPDNSITKIYSSHVLEHFYYQDLIKLLTECHRILKPNGVFSVCVPNAGMYVEAYLSQDEFKPKSFYKPAFHINTKIDLINYMAYMDGHHKYMFDRENLLAILKKVGFNKVDARRFDAEIDREERDWESIYAQGEK